MGTNLAPRKRKTTPPAKPKAEPLRCRGCGGTIDEEKNPRGFCAGCDPERSSRNLDRQAADDPYGLRRCQDCGEPLTAAEWKLCLDDATRPKLCCRCDPELCGTPADQVLSTTTPTGIATFDPDAGLGFSALDLGTKKRRPKREDQSPKTQAQRPKIQDLPLDEIARSPWQPRETFPEAEIEALAASLQAQGQLSPIAVRPIAEGGEGRAESRRLSGRRGAGSGSGLSALSSPLRYELVAGERRVRAALKLGWAEIRAELWQLDDAAAQELCLTENAQRKDLNPLEQARAWSRWLERPGATQAALAELVGCAQSHISLVCGLVKLPQPARELIAAGKLPPTHARALLPYAEHPKIVEAALKNVAGEGAGTVSEFERQVRVTVREKAARLYRSVHTNEGGAYRYTDLRIDKKHPQYAQLEVVEIPSGWGKEKYALNAPLARQILGEKAKAWHARHGKPKEEAKKGGKAKAKEKSPAELKREAREAAERRRLELEHLVLDWRQWLCAERIAAPQALASTTLGATLYAPGAPLRLLVSTMLDGTLYEAFEELLCKLWNTRGGVAGQSGLVARVWRLPVGELVEELTKCLVEMLSRQALDHDSWDAPEEDLVAAMCAALKVDPEAAWRSRAEGKQAFAGPFTEKLWALYTREQLVELAAAWKVPLVAAESMTHEALVLRLTGNAARIMPLPEDLAAIVKGNKGKGKPK